MPKGAKIHKTPKGYKLSWNLAAVEAPVAVQGALAGLAHAKGETPNFVVVDPNQTPTLKTSENKSEAQPVVTLLDPITHQPNKSIKVYMVRDWLAGVKVIPQLKHKVEKGQDLTFGETMVLGAYRLGEGLHWLWKEILKPMLKSLSEGMKKVLGKGLYNLIVFIVICVLIWKVWNVLHIGFHPINWIESKFNHEQSTTEPTPVSTPMASTLFPKVEAAVTHLVPEKKTEKPAVSPAGISSPSFIPSVQRSVTQEDAKVLEMEMAAIPAHCVVKDYPLTPDEAMPGDLAASRLQDLTNADKYTMKLGRDMEKILSVSPSHTNLIIAFKSSDALGGFVDGSNQINFFWEDVKYIHSDEIDVQSKVPAVIYQCSLIVDGAKNPLTIQCSRPEDLEHLVSTMEYFIRSSRLAHDAQPAGLPYPNQGLVLTNDCLTDKLWADSPMDKAGVKLGDMIWSVDKNAGLQPERKALETQLSALTSGSHNLFLVSPSDREKELIVMNQTHSSYFNPKRHKALLTTF